MATEADIPEAISITKGEREDRYLTSRQFEGTVDEFSPVELEKIEGAPSQPPDTVQYSKETENMQEACDVGVETMNNVTKCNIGTSEGKNILESPSAAKVASQDTYGISVHCQADEIANQAEKEKSENENQLQKDGKLEAFEDKRSEEYEVMEEKKEKPETESENHDIVSVADTNFQKANTNELAFKVEGEGTLGKTDENTDFESNKQDLNLVEATSNQNKEALVRASDLSVNSLDKDVETVTEACNKDENLENTSSASSALIQKELRETSFEGVDDKESEKSSNLVDGEKGPEAVRPTEKMSNGRDEKQKIPHESNGDAPSSTLLASPEIQIDQEAFFEIDEGAAGKFDRPSVTLAIDDSSVEEAGVEVGEKLKEGSSAACTEKTQDTIKSSEIMKDVIPVEDDMQATNNLDAPFETQRNEMCLQKVDNPEIFKVVSEIVPEDTVKESPKEVEDQTEILEKTAPADQTEILEQTAQVDSSGSEKVNGDENPEEKLDSPSMKHEEGMQSESEGQPVTEASAGENRKEEGFTVAVAEDNISNTEVIKAVNQGDIELAKHREDPEDSSLQQTEPEKEKLGTTLNVVAEEIETAASSENAETKESPGKNLEESFEEKGKEDQPTDNNDISKNGIPMAKNLPLIDSNEKIESEEVEISNSNSNPLHVTHSSVKETVREEGENLDEVSKVAPEVQGHESTGIFTEEDKHIENTSEAYQRSESTILEHTSTEVVETMEMISTSENTGKLDSEENLEVKDGSEDIEKVGKKDEACDTEIDTIAPKSDDIEEGIGEEDAPLKVPSALCIGHEPVEKSRQVEILEEEALNLNTEDKSHKSEDDVERNNIIDVEVHEGLKITGTREVTKEQIIEGNVPHLLPESIEEETIKNSQDNEKEAEMSQGEETTEQIIIEGNVKHLPLQSTGEGSSENFKDREKEAETSQKQIIEESETAGAVESIAHETNQDNGIPETILDTSLVKQEESLLGEGENLAPMEASTEDKREEDKSSVKVAEVIENNGLDEAKVNGAKDKSKSEEDSEQIFQKDETEEKVEGPVNVMPEETEAGASSENGDKITSLEGDGAIQNLEETSDKETKEKETKDTNDTKENETANKEVLETMGWSQKTKEQIVEEIDSVKDESPESTEKETIKEYSKEDQVCEGLETTVSSRITEKQNIEQEAVKDNSPESTEKETIKEYSQEDQVFEGLETTISSTITEEQNIDQEAVKDDSPESTGKETIKEYSKEDQVCEGLETAVSSTITEKQNIEQEAVKDDSPESTKKETIKEYSKEDQVCEGLETTLSSTITEKQNKEQEAVKDDSPESTEKETIKEYSKKDQVCEGLETTVSNTITEEQNIEQEAVKDDSPEFTEKETIKEYSKENQVCEGLETAVSSTITEKQNIEQEVVSELSSSLVGEETVTKNLKEDESDAMTLKEEVEGINLEFEEQIETASTTEETKSKTLEDRAEPNKNHNALNITNVSAEEIHTKESIESLIENSSFVTEVPEKDIKREILEKEESTINYSDSTFDIVATDEMNLKEETVMKISKEEEIDAMKLKEEVEGIKLEFKEHIEGTSSMEETKSETLEDRAEPNKNHNALNIAEVSSEEIHAKESIENLVENSSFVIEVPEKEIKGEILEKEEPTINYSDSTFDKVATDEMNLKEETVMKISKEEEIDAMKLKEEVEGIKLEFKEQIEATSSTEETKSETLEDRAEPNKNHNALNITEVSSEEIHTKESIENLVENSSFVTEVPEKKIKGEILEKEEPTINYSDSAFDTVATDEMNMKVETGMKISKEEEIDAMKLKEEVKGIKLEFKEQIEATSSTEETKSETLEDRAEPTKNQNALNIAEVSSEEIHRKESIESLVENSSFVTEVLGKEIKGEILEKEEPTTNYFDSALDTVTTDKMNLKEETGTKISKEEEIDGMKVKEEVEGVKLELKEQIEATSSTEETKSETLEDRVETNKNHDALNTAEASAEEIHTKESIETLVGNSSFVTEVPEKEIKGEILEKEEPIVNYSDSAFDTVATEEMNLKEEPEDIIQVKSSDLAHEEKGPATIEAKGTSLDNVGINVKPEDNSNLKEIRDKEVQTVANETGEKIENETQDKAPTTGSDDQKEATTSETPLDDMLEDNLQDSSTMPSKENDFVTTEASKTDETPVRDETPNEKAETPIIVQKTEEKLLQQEDKYTKPNDVPELEHLDIGKVSANEEVQKHGDEELYMPPKLHTGKNISESKREETNDLADQSESYKSETSKEEESLNIGLEKDKPEDEKPFVEASKCNAVGTCTDSENAILEEEDSAKNFEGSLKEGNEVEKLAAELEAGTHSHGSEATNTKDNCMLTEENLESADPGEKLKCTSETVVEDQRSATLPKVNKSQLEENSNAIQDQSLKYVEQQIDGQKFQEGEKHTEEEIEPKLDVGDHISKTQNVNETIKADIFNEEVHKGVEKADEDENIKEQVHKGVEKADEDENIKEQVIEEESDLKELHTVFEDETVNEISLTVVKDSPLSSDYLEATESDEQTKILNSELEESPTREREASVAKASEEEELQDKGSVKSVDVSAAIAGDSEEKIKEEADNSYDKIDTATVTVVKSETTMGEIQLDDKPIEASDARSLEAINTNASLRDKELDSVKLEETSSDLVSQHPTTDHENAEKENATVENSDVAEDEVSEIAPESVFNHVVEESDDSGQNRVVEKLDANKIEEETKEASESADQTFPEGKSEQLQTPFSALLCMGQEHGTTATVEIKEASETADQTFPAGKSEEQLQKPSSTLFFKEREYGTTTIENIENENRKEAETLEDENVEDSSATKTTEDGSEIAHESVFNQVVEESDESGQIRTVEKLEADKIEEETKEASESADQTFPEGKSEQQLQTPFSALLCTGHEHGTTTMVEIKEASETADQTFPVGKSEEQLQKPSSLLLFKEQEHVKEEGSEIAPESVFNQVVEENDESGQSRIVEMLDADKIEKETQEASESANQTFSEGKSEQQLQTPFSTLLCTGPKHGTITTVEIKEASETADDTFPEGKFEEQLQKPSSSLVFKEQEHGTTTVEKIEKENMKEAKTLEYENAEDSSTAKTTGERCLNKEVPKELEVSNLGLELNKKIRKVSPNRVQEEEGITKDGLKPQGNVVEIEDANSTVESEKITELPRPVEEVSKFKFETSEKASEPMLEVQNHEVVTKLEDTEIEEKHLEAAITDLRTEDIQSEQTLEAIEIIKNEVSNEQIREEKEVSKESHQVPLGKETMIESHQEDELKADNYPGENTNETIKTPVDGIQNEELSEEFGKASTSDDVEKHIIVEDRIVKDSDLVFVENETTKESFPDEVEGKNANEAAIKMDHENQGGESKSGNSTSEGTTQREEELGIQIPQKEGTLCPIEGNEIAEDIQQLDKNSSATSERQIPREADPNESTETVISTGNKYVPPVPQDPIAETLQKAEAGDLEPGNATGVISEVKRVEHRGESIMDDSGEKTTEEPTSMDEAEISLSNLMQRSKKETLQVAENLTGGREPTASGEEMQTEEAESVKVKEAITDEEEGDEHQKTESGSEAPVMVEASRDMDVKVAHKKSHNILSGVGSRVKHSISKVKKAITGKSSHPKTVSPK